MKTHWNQRREGVKLKNPRAAGSNKTRSWWKEHPSFHQIGWKPLNQHHLHFNPRTPIGKIRPFEASWLDSKKEQNLFEKCSLGCYLSCCCQLLYVSCYPLSLSNFFSKVLVLDTQWLSVFIISFNIHPLSSTPSYSTLPLFYSNLSIWKETPSTTRSKKATF